MIDTNVIIDLIAGKLPREGEQWLESILAKNLAFISIINKIELLGFNGPVDEMSALNSFADYVTVLPLSDEVAENAIKVRITRKIKLPDAIIAATARVHNLTLVSRNVKDFTGIEGVDSLDAHEI